MSLQGRELAIRMEDEDVQYLQRELRQLDFDVPGREANVHSFAKKIREAGHSW